MAEFEYLYDFKFSFGILTTNGCLGLMCQTVPGKHTEHRRRPNFPSWSWTGWFNAVEYGPNLGLGPPPADERSINWEKAMDTGVLDIVAPCCILDPAAHSYLKEGKTIMDNGSEWVGPRKCLLLAHNGWLGMYGGPNIPTLTLLVLNKLENGNYERIGFWESLAYNLESVNRWYTIEKGTARLITMMNNCKEEQVCLV